jgi:hypothetical protein
MPYLIIDFVCVNYLVYKVILAIFLDSAQQTAAVLGKNKISHIHEFTSLHQQGHFYRSDIREALLRIVINQA